MARRRKPSHISPKSELDDSWVFENEDEDEDEEKPSWPSSMSNARRNEEDAVTTSAPNYPPLKYSPASAPRTPSRRVSRQADLEFIMPSIDETGTNGSHISSASSVRKRKTSDRSSKSDDSEPHALDRSVATNGLKSWIKQINTAGKSILWYAYDVLGEALGTLKTPLSYLIAALFFVLLLSMVWNVITLGLHKVYLSAVSPLCSLPGSSRFLTLCNLATISTYEKKSAEPVDFAPLIALQDQFEQVAVDAADHDDLSNAMMRSRQRTGMIRSMVSFSDLQFKNSLLEELNGFIELAEALSDDIMTFNVKATTAVDMILIRNRMTKEDLERIALESASRSAASALINKVLAPFKSSDQTEKSLRYTYIRHSYDVERQIDRVLDASQKVLKQLKGLEERLEAMYQIARENHVHIQGTKDQVLPELFTLLKLKPHAKINQVLSDLFTMLKLKNGAKVRELNEQLKTIQEIYDYRQTAWSHVAGVALKLKAMKAEFGGLQERVMSAEEVVDSSKMPLSLHMEYVERSIERLTLPHKYVHGKDEDDKKSLRALLHGSASERSIPREIRDVSLKRPAIAR
ncbi:hypothetical protein MMC20_005221 [Loxospora ochrophaea]|nr:hypothetical protein [Loxospora ochrophaea]